MPYFPPQPTYTHALLIANHLLDFRYQLKYTSGVMEERVRSTSELWQYLAGTFLAQGPGGEVIATARGATNWENLPKLGRSPLLDDEDGLNAPAELVSQS